MSDLLSYNQIANSGDYFYYLNDLWQLLPESDRFIFGETWKAYERCLGFYWMQLMESRLSICINNVPLYNDYRWSQYTFTSDNQVETAASYESPQDFSEPLDLHAVNTLLVAVNGGPATLVTLTGVDPFAVTSLEIANSINNAFQFAFAGLSDNNAILTLTSDVAGSTSEITFYAVGTVFQEGTLTDTFSEITVPSTEGIAAGYLVSGEYIQAGTTVEEVVDETTLILSQGVTVGDGIATVPLTFYPVTQSANDASALVLGLDFTQLPYTLPEYPWMYTLGDTTIAGIPILQDAIHPELVETTLSQDVDFTIQFGTGIIQFSEQPSSESTWYAPDTLMNLNTPYNNFGWLMDIYAPNTPSYLKAVQGLWFAFWTGPTPVNIETSLYLLFGLPTASQIGTVTAANGTSISLTYIDGSTESFSVPSGLTNIVNAGDSVTQFQPLVSGIKVYDKVNSPGFLAREVGTAGILPYLTQYATLGPGPNTDETMALTLLEQNTFMPSISVYAFFSQDISLDNIDTFLSEIRPMSRNFFFDIVAAQLLDLLSFEDHVDLAIDMNVTPNLDNNPNTYASEHELVFAEHHPEQTGIRLDCVNLTCFDLIDVAVYQRDTLIDSFRVTS